jgi:hypothetical protein
MEPVAATGGAGIRRRLRRSTADIEERHGDRLAQVRALPGSAGTRTVRENLVAALAELSVMRDVVPAQMQLRDELVALQEHEIAALADEVRPAEGPAHWIADYLRAEQRCGRVRPDLNCEMTALCLLATLLGLVLTPGPPAPNDLLAAVVEEHVRTLVDGVGVR